MPKFEQHPAYKEDDLEIKNKKELEEAKKAAGVTTHEKVMERFEHNEKVSNLAQEFAGPFNNAADKDFEKAQQKFEREEKLSDSQKKRKDSLTSQIGHLDQYWYESRGVAGWENAGETRVDHMLRDFYKEHELPAEIKGDVINDSIVKLFERGKWWHTVEVADRSGIDKSKIDKNRMLLAFKKGIIEDLSGGEYNIFLLNENEDRSRYHANAKNAEEVKRRFSISNESITKIEQSIDVRYAAITGIVEHIAKGHDIKTEKFCSIYSSKLKLDSNSKDKMLFLRAAQEVIIGHLHSKYEGQEALRVKDYFQLPNTPEIQEAAEIYLVKFIESNNYSPDYIKGAMQQVKKNFNLPDQMIEEAEIKGIRNAFIRHNEWYSALAIQEVAQLPISKLPADIVEAAQKSLSVLYDHLKKAQKEKNSNDEKRWKDAIEKINKFFLIG